MDMFISLLSSIYPTTHPSICPTTQCAFLQILRVPLSQVTILPRTLLRFPPFLLSPPSTEASSIPAPGLWPNPSPCQLPASPLLASKSPPTNVTDVTRYGFQVSGPLVWTPSPLIPSPCAESEGWEECKARVDLSHLSWVDLPRGGRRSGWSEEAMVRLPLSPWFPSVLLLAHQRSKRGKRHLCWIPVAQPTPDGVVEKEILSSNVSQTEWNCNSGPVRSPLWLQFPCLCSRVGWSSKNQSWKWRSSQTALSSCYMLRFPGLLALAFIFFQYWCMWPTADQQN